MSKNFKTLACCILALLVASVTVIAVFADSSSFVAEESESVSAEDMTDTETVIKLGDVNFDGKIRAGDARLALRFAAGIDTPATEEFIAADVNVDGKVKAGDARLILRVAAGIDDESVFGSVYSDTQEDYSAE